MQKEVDVTVEYELRYDFSDKVPLNGPRLLIALQGDFYMYMYTYMYTDLG